MRRELRRHPIQAKPTRGTNRPPRIPRSGGGRPGGGGTSTPARTRGNLPVIPKRWQTWYLDIFSELRKVQWPTWQETRNLTVVVIVVSAALGLGLGGLDAVFGWLFENTLLR